MNIISKIQEAKTLNPIQYYTLIIVFTFALFGNTLTHEYALDDALVVTHNEYVISGMEGIPDIFKEELFNGFFDQKDKDLVAGGRYRPVSLMTFAIEYELFMGSPYDGLDKDAIRKRLNQNTKERFITPFNKLSKDLVATFNIRSPQKRKQLQNLVLEKNGIPDAERTVILTNLKKMHKRQSTHQFVAHFVNVSLYALTNVFLFAVLSLLFAKYNVKRWYLSIPFVATMLFIAHPVHTEVVANIKGRDEILAFCISMITLFLSIKYIDTKKSIYLASTFVAALVAVFSKEVAITFAALIPVTLWFFRDTKIKNILIITLPIILAGIIYLYVRSNMVAGINGISVHESTEIMNNSFYGMDFATKYATIFYTLLLYIKLLFIPHPLTYDYYPYHVPAMSWDLLPILSVLVYLGLAVIAIRGLLKKKVISYGIIWFVICLSPTSNILFSIGVFMNERFIYGASLGFVIILAWFITQKLPQILKPEAKYLKYTTLGIVLLLSLYSLKTITRNSVWKNDFTLFTTDVKTSFNSAKSTCSAGGKLFEEAQQTKNTKQRIEYLDLSIRYLHQALKIHPRYSDALLLMGNAQLERNKNLDSAFHYYHRLFQLYPRHKLAIDNIFSLDFINEYNKAEQADASLRGFTLVKPYIQHKWQTHYYIGRINGRYKNNIPLAIQHFLVADSLSPNNLDIYKDLGVAYGISRQFERSTYYFLKAIELDPQDVKMSVNTIQSLVGLQRHQEAIDISMRILDTQLPKEDAASLMNLAMILRSINQAQLSEQAYQKAIHLEPNLQSKGL